MGIAVHDLSNNWQAILKCAFQHSGFEWIPSSRRFFQDGERADEQLSQHNPDTTAAGETRAGGD
jgi:hypothetical protein